MQIGIPRERKDGEPRVGMLPDGVSRLRAAGHGVLVESGAGEGAGFPDHLYAAAGARVVADADEVMACPLVVKVKELQPAEFVRLRPATTIFAFAQLARDRALLAAVLAARINYIAYESVRDAHGGLPLLAPMSRIAGRLAPVIAASLLLNDRGGSGVLLPGLDGVAAGRVLIIGAGMVGSEAAGVAVGIGAEVIVLARSESVRAALSTRFGDAITVRGCDAATVAESAAQSDVIIGAVLDRGKLSPKLVTRAMLRTMRPRSVLIDIGIDQGGIAETSRQTMISAPTFVEEGIIHYGVPNIPALVPRTATMALTQATFPYVLAMADSGIGPAIAADSGLRAGLQTSGGRITHEGLAADAGEACVEPAWHLLARGDEVQYNPAAPIRP